MWRIRPALGIAWRATADIAPSAPITARVRTCTGATRSVRGGPVMHDDNVVGIAGQSFKAAVAALGARGDGAATQPFIEHRAIDHADKPALNRHVDPARRRGDHPRRRHP